MESQFSVPPGFRFHPTDEELLSYYLRKKMAREFMELDVIREIDLNKLEPWNLRDICRIGSGPQNEWYFFSHKDKKYPSGTRTNRATEAGFWKATGRDKIIFHSNSNKLGMRKTLVFYTGRAPRGQKTDWIMHEYRLHSDNHMTHEEGWVVCRVYRKKKNQRSLALEEELEREAATWGQRYNTHWSLDSGLGNSMQLPQLLSPDPCLGSFMALGPNPNNLSFSRSSVKLPQQQHQRFYGDLSVVDKLLASHQNLDQIFQGKWNPLEGQTADHVFSSLRFPPHSSIGSEADLLKLLTK